MQTTKLTEQEQAQMDKFIAKWVWGNKTMPNQTKFNVSTQMTVQDICNAHVETLQKIGTAIKREAEKVDPEFTDGKGLSIAGTPADTVVQFLKLVIRKKKHEEEIKDKKKDLKEAQETIDNAKSPEERRREAEALKANLERELQGELEEVS